MKFANWAFPSTTIFLIFLCWIFDSRKQSRDQHVFISTHVPGRPRGVIDELCPVVPVSRRGLHMEHSAELFTATQLSSARSPKTARRRRGRSAAEERSILRLVRYAPIPTTRSFGVPKTQRLQRWQ